MIKSKFYLNKITKNDIVFGDHVYIIINSIPGPDSNLLEQHLLFGHWLFNWIAETPVFLKLGWVAEVLQQ